MHRCFCEVGEFRQNDPRQAEAAVAGAGVGADVAECGGGVRMPRVTEETSHDYTPDVSLKTCLRRASLMSPSRRWASARRTASPSGLSR